MVQRRPSAETATLAWVRALTRGSRSQAKRHTSHRQFHCGNPPPPPERGTTAVRCRPRTAAGEARSELVRQIAVDLEADADFDERRGGPSHGFPHLFRPSATACCSKKNASAAAPGTQGSEMPAQTHHAFAAVIGYVEISRSCGGAGAGFPRGGMIVL